MPTGDGALFTIREASVVDVLGSLGDYTIAVNDPPWSAVRELVPPPRRVVHAWDMDLASLEARLDESDVSEVVVGLGGGTALDTAKFLAWRGNKRLVQVPTITSVDAGFTDAIGVRVDGKVRYVGKVTPELVVLDIPLVQSAPERLNRAGIGDILSCHTGLYDWATATNSGLGAPWREDLALLGRSVLAELDAAAPDVRAVSADGVRFMASAYRRIGAACAQAGHSRFEEGSEHFWAYCYEHATAMHQVHGELVTLGVATMSFIQDNEPERVVDLVARCGTRAHPDALGITHDQFVEALVTLRAYTAAEGLDASVVDVVDIGIELAERAWQFVQRLADEP